LFDDIFDRRTESSSIAEAVIRDFTLPDTMAPSSPSSARTVNDDLDLTPHTREIAFALIS
jgi:hypothetical protein